MKKISKKKPLSEINFVSKLKKKKAVIRDLEKSTSNLEKYQNKETEEKPITKKKDDEMGFFKTLFLALICAGVIRSLFFEPFHIPSGSMKPTLLVGDYIFVSKYSYGYSRYSFPFGLNLFSGRIFKKTPTRGDIVVFRLPSDPSINYVKRLVGLPRDRLQMRDGVLFVNDEEVVKIADGEFKEKIFDEEVRIPKFIEKFPNGKQISTLDIGLKPEDNTGIYEVPEGHYFFMGDNRDNSQDSRFLTKVGYVPEENLIGKATMIFFSIDNPFWQIWNWPTSVRFKRIFHQLN